VATAGRLHLSGAGTGPFFCFVLSYSHVAYLDYGGALLTVSPPLSAL